MPAEPGVLDRDEKGIKAKPSSATPRRSDSIRKMPRLTTVAERPISGWAGSTRHSPITPRPSALLRLTPMPACRGLIHAVRGDFEAAIADYDEAIRIQPDHAKAHGNRAMPGEPRRLPACAGRILAGDRDQSRERQGLRHRAIVHFKLEQLDESIADYSEAIRLNPNNAKTFRNRGAVYSKNTPIRQSGGRFR